MKKEGVSHKSSKVTRDSPFCFAHKNRPGRAYVGGDMIAGEIQLEISVMLCAMWGNSLRISETGREIGWVSRPLSLNPGLNAASETKTSV